MSNEHTSVDAADNRALPEVGARDGHPVDPTKNVLDLVFAESKYQNGMREAESKFQNGMRKAESRRLYDLAELRVMYEARISEVLTVQVKTTSELISTQLDKVTTALGLQITSSVNSLLERIGQLERFRWEVGGKTSVQDPAISSELTAMTLAISSINARLDRGEGMGIGQDRSHAVQTISTTQGTMMVGAIVAVLTFGLNYFAQRPTPAAPQIVYLPSGTMPSPPVPVH